MKARDYMICNVDTYSSGCATDVDNINSLANGAIAAFNEDGTLIDATAVPPVPNGNYVRFAYGRTTDGPKFSKLIPRIGSSEFSYTKEVYAAGTPMVRTLTGVASYIPSAVLTGDQFGVIIRDLRKGYEDNLAQKRFEYIATAGDGAAEIGAGLKAAVNDAVVDLEVTADYTGGNMTFTADVVDYSFEVVAYGEVEWEAIPETVSTPLVNTTGMTGTNLLEWVKDIDAYNGRTDTHVTTPGMWDATSIISTSINYTLYTLTWYPNRTNKRYNKSNPDRIELLIAVDESDTTVIANLDALLAVI